MSVDKVLDLAQTIVTIQMTLPQNKQTINRTMLMKRHQRIAQLFSDDFWGMRWRSQENIYNAPNKEVAAAELDNLEKKWGGKYPYAILSWRNNWDDLTVFFQFPLEIRKIIYTTNLIENLNGKIRKYTKSKLSFPSDDAVKKTVYLSLMEIEKKWTQPIHNWGLIMNQFMLIFENRIQI